MNHPPKTTDDNEIKLLLQKTPAVIHFSGEENKSVSLRISKRISGMNEYLSQVTLMWLI